MLLDCCSGHICSSCLKDVRKTFQSCPLCRKSGYSAIKSRFMMSFCSKIQLVCPVESCNTAVPYLKFEEHKKRCLELSMQKMSLENHAAKNIALTKELDESKKINKEKKKEIASLKAKINCKDEKIATMEKMYNDQKELTKVIRKNHRELSDKKIELEERFSQVKKENYEYEKEARKTCNQGDNEIVKMKEYLCAALRKNQVLEEDNEKCKKLLEQKLRENFKFQSQCKEQA